MRHEEDEIDLRELLSTLWRYRISILLFVLVFTGGALIYAYFKPNVYQATSLIKVEPKVRNYGTVLNDALYPEINALQNELAIFSSRKLAELALRDLKLGIRYFAVDHWKEVELYKRSPFVVRVEKLSPVLYGRAFRLRPLAGDRFLLELTTPWYERWLEFLGIGDWATENRSISYRKIHRFGEKISTPWFDLQVRKEGELRAREYRFSAVPEASMASFIQGGISASAFAKEGNVVRLTFRDTVPRRAEEILQAMVEAYKKNNVSYRVKSAERQLGFIEERLKEIERKLEASSLRLQEYKRSKELVSLDEQVGRDTETLSRYKERLFDIEMKIGLLEKVLDSLGKGNAPKLEDFSYVQSFDPVIGALIQELETGYANLSAMEIGYTPRHPKRLAEERRIQSLERSLRRKVGTTLQLLKGERKEVSKRIASLRGKVLDLPEEEQRLGALTRDFAVYKKIYTFLQEKKAEIAINKASIVPEMMVLDRARVSYVPVKPRRSLIVLVGVILGWILGIAQALIREFFNNKIQNQNDLTKLTELPLYGVLPQMKSKKSIAYYFESMRGLWVNLSFMQSKKSVKVICITSTIPGEGKTLTVANIGRTLAKGAGKRVILLDLDMRKAKLHRHFDVSHDLGMSTLLSGKSTLDEVIQKTEIEGLDLIASGPRTSNPTGLIMSLVLESVLEELSGRYDYVLLDTPPIGLVADAKKIVRMADLTLFVVRAGLTRKEFVEEINREREESQGNVGVILNGVEIEKEYDYAYKMGYMEEYLIHRG